MEVLILLASILSFTLIVLYRRQKRRMMYFKKLGIPGPPPHFIKGNMNEIDEKGLGECHRQWIEKYGNIIGYYIGHTPIILTTDLELLKIIQIKHFAHFPDRIVIVPPAVLPATFAFHSINVNTGSKWKKTRSILSPAFTSGKIKQMCNLMESSIEDLLHILKESSKDDIDIHKVYAKLSLDIIGKTSFGIKTNAQYNSNSPFVANSEIALAYSLEYTSIRWLVYFPDFAPLIFYFRVFCDNLRYLLKLPSTTGLYKIVAEVIAARKSNTQKKCDLIQLMLESKISSQQLKTSDYQTLTADAISTNEKKEAILQENADSEWQYMTDTEIQSNAVLFLLAGHHTTSTCLSYTTFLLSTHQNIQENIRQELLNAVQLNGKLGYEDVMNLNYMDQVISESLRIYPPVITFVTRKSNNEFRYKNYIFPKNANFQAALWVLHRDPEIWEEPLSFKPERFSQENRSKIGISYQPFGTGPRNCVGMRFALLEIKLILAKLLLSYRIVPSSQTNLDVGHKVSFTAPKKGVRVRLIPLSM